MNSLPYFAGFLGKVIVEKLLRDTDVNKVYLLIRTKKGVAPYERLESFKKHQVSYLQKIKNCVIGIIKC